MAIGRPLTNELRRWFGSPSSLAGTDLTLFCLPYAGGGASAFAGWRRELPGRVDVVPVWLPGREARFGEPPHLDAEEIAAALAARLNGPYAIYGHSMGARLAFEVTRVLRRCHVQLPRRLYVAAARPPQVPDPWLGLADLPDDELVGALIEHYAAPPELRDDHDVRALQLPVLRSDFGWLRRNLHRDEPPLPVPVVAFAGLADRTVPPYTMLGWASHTRARFRLHTVPGDHFFLRSPRSGLTGLLAADLIAAAGRDDAGDDAGDHAVDDADDADGQTVTGGRR